MTLQRHLPNAVEKTHILLQYLIWQSIKTFPSHQNCEHVIVQYLAEGL